MRSIARLWNSLQTILTSKYHVLSQLYIIHFSTLIPKFSENDTCIIFGGKMYQFIYSFNLDLVKIADGGYYTFSAHAQFQAPNFLMNVNKSWMEASILYLKNAWKDFTLLRRKFTHKRVRMCKCIFVCVLILLSCTFTSMFKIKHD
jgi:hypothetical protein